MCGAVCISLNLYECNGDINKILSFFSVQCYVFKNYLCALGRSSLLLLTMSFHSTSITSTRHLLLTYSSRDESCFHKWCWNRHPCARLLMDLYDTGSPEYVLRMNNTKLFITLSEHGNTFVSRLWGFFPLITSMHLILASFYYCQCYWHKIGSSYYLLAFLWLIVRLNISAFFSKPFVYPSFWSSESLLWTECFCSPRIPMLESNPPCDGIGRWRLREIMRS